MMTSLQPLWWLALPVLLLPVWWHLQKRERIKTESLATARFLPSAAPQQQRVLRWSDPLLLLLRLLLLTALLAWLAVLSLSWRGDTVLLDPALATPEWTERQLADAGMQQAARTALPPDALSWLQRHEGEWRHDARILVLARALPMEATPPRLAHQLDIRLAPAPAASKPVAVREHHIVVKAPAGRLPLWRTLFSAFGTAGDGQDRYILADAPTSNTELIVWDHAGAPPQDWRSPLWWRTANGPLPQAARINGLVLQIEDTAQGRSWSSTAWPLSDVDGARALFETWRQLSAPMPPYPMPAQSYPALAKRALAVPGAAEPARWLAWALLCLFALERGLSHARRR